MDEFPRGFIVSAVGPIAPPLEAPPSEKCGPVKFHSRQKHEWIESYFRIWTGHVKPQSRPSLDIVDLYASYGWCLDKESGDRWAGTAVRAATLLKNYEAKAKNALFLNSFSADADELAKQSGALQEALDAVGPLKGTRVHPAFHLPIEQAIEKILPLVNKNFPNVWILDPYVADELPWSVVEMITNNVGQRKVTSGKDKGKMIPRKPELFITFMLWSLQKCVNSPKHARMADRAFGIPESEWRPKLDAYIAKGHTLTEALTEVYRDRLMQVYQRPPLSFVVKGVEKNIVYALFFCSDEPAGYHSMREKGQEYFEEWRAKDYEPKAEALKEQRLEARSEHKEEVRIEGVRKVHAMTFDDFVEKPKQG